MNLWIAQKRNFIYVIIVLFAQCVESKGPPITIMIHGTSRTTNFFEIVPPVHRILADWLRTPNGLHHASALSKDHNFARIAQTLHEADPSMFDVNHFYFFGWRGYLCPTERLAAGGDIFKGIYDLLTQECYKDSPLTIITHSHGGNVGLSIAHYLMTKDMHFTVERLILLACPIQDKTEEYAASPMFKHVHNLFSGADWLQVLDPQGLEQGFFNCFFNTTLFSRRTFKESLPVNNVKIVNRKRGLSHVGFIHPSFYVTLPTLIRALESTDQCAELRYVAPRLYQADLAKMLKKEQKLL